MNSADFVFGGFFVRPQHLRSRGDLQNSPGHNFGKTASGFLFWYVLISGDLLYDIFDNPF